VGASGQDTPGDGGKLTGIERVLIIKYQLNVMECCHSLVSESMSVMENPTIDIPEFIPCGICFQVCKRGVKVLCCNIRACRSCATLHVTRKKVCWNTSCGKQIKTRDLVNDEALREDVKKYQNYLKNMQELPAPSSPELSKPGFAPVLPTYSLECPFCGDFFPSNQKVELQSHVEQHMEGMLECPICNLTFEKGFQLLLETHVEFHFQYQDHVLEEGWDLGFN